ncbi:MAG TPA: Rieske 2Fe-2S domain-containing protein [Verrucomicrobiae bacterium]|jgi:nitrite reductase/ring-hydroxylating ferredoxin subunit/DMSO/TMAO reductase YedYZ heme-binding membrane subunit|nr:Rieske 2Fe-2S domain-containing protein [Verrucomicrobiae bacterium]
MGTAYVAVQWNRQKRFYDAVLIGGVAIYLGLFAVLTEKLFPYVTDEIMIMRAFGTAAFLLLHVILCIGPLCRLNPKYLPLLYNRRHAGVTMFILALVHAIFVLATYHAGGDVNPFLAIFVSTPFKGTIFTVPFQAFGFFALVILFLMAATSHDFWLANLSAPVWKSLHMLVYVAYALLVLHVVFGILQSETSPVYTVAVAIGFVTVASVHLKAARREIRLDAEWHIGQPPEEFVDVCAVSDIPENRARMICLSDERVAIFKYDGKISAVSNVCQHQNGPLGEGKIVSGCITCPWHGYQYQPDTGASPPPFVEKVPTFNVRVKNGRVLVQRKPNPAGVRAEPALITT